MQIPESRKPSLDSVQSYDTLPSKLSAFEQQKNSVASQGGKNVKMLQFLLPNRHNAWPVKMQSGTQRKMLAVRKAIRPDDRFPFSIQLPTSGWQESAASCPFSDAMRPPRSTSHNPVNDPSDIPGNKGEKRKNVQGGVRKEYLITSGVDVLRPHLCLAWTVRNVEYRKEYKYYRNS